MKPFLCLFFSIRYGHSLLIKYNLYPSKMSYILKENRIAKMKSITVIQTNVEAFSLADKGKLIQNYSKLSFIFSERHLCRLVPLNASTLLDILGSSFHNSDHRFNYQNPIKNF